MILDAPGPPASTPWAPPAPPKAPLDPSEQEILDDPIYQAALGNANYNIDTGRRSLRDQIRQLVINSGYNPTLSGELAGYAADVDEGTRAAAATNQFSTRAQARAGLSLGQRKLRYSLAARGILGSGALASGQSFLGMSTAAREHQNMLDLLNKITAGAGTYTGLQATERGTLADAMNATAMRLAAQPGPTYDTPLVPAAVPATVPATVKPKPTTMPLATAAAIARGTAFGKVPRSKLNLWGGG